MLRLLLLLSAFIFFIHDNVDSLYSDYSEDCSAVYYVMCVLHQGSGGICMVHIHAKIMGAVSVGM